MREMGVKIISNLKDLFILLYRHIADGIQNKKSK